MKEHVPKELWGEARSALANLEYIRLFELPGKYSPLVDLPSPDFRQFVSNGAIERSRRAAQLSVDDWMMSRGNICDTSLDDEYREIMNNPWVNWSLYVLVSDGPKRWGLFDPDATCLPLMLEAFEEDPSMKALMGYVESHVPCAVYECLKVRALADLVNYVFDGTREYEVKPPYQSWEASGEGLENVTCVVRYCSAYWRLSTSIAYPSFSFGFFEQMASPHFIDEYTNLREVFLQHLAVDKRWRGRQLDVRFNDDPRPRSTTIEGYLGRDSEGLKLFVCRDTARPGEMYIADEDCFVLSSGPQFLSQFLLESLAVSLEEYFEQKIWRP